MSLIRRFHPEAGIDGFASSDGTIRFYGFVWGAAFRTKARRILDYGAGRGRFHFANTPERGSLYRRHLRARTPSKWGYVALISAMIPNRLHARILARAQTDRQEEDVFPTFYHLNTVADIRRHFPGCEVMHYHTSAAPGYAFGSALAYRAFGLLHCVLPGPLNTSLCAFIRKREDAGPTHLRNGPTNTGFATHALTHDRLTIASKFL